MSARTEEELLDLIDDEFAWRRKELSAILASVRSSPAKPRTELRRAGITLLYAHWEGFVKAASEAYVQYVRRMRLQYAELCPGFLAMALRNKLNALSTSEDPAEHIAFVQFISSDLSSHAQLPKLGVIKTGNNLNSQRLKRIIVMLD
jgi:hypothetical protein